MRITAIAAALAMVTGGATEAVAHSALGPEETFRQDAQALADAARADRCEAVLPLVRRITVQFSSVVVDDAFRSAVWALGVGCALRQKLPEEAFADVRELTRLPDASDEVWTLQLELAVELNRPDDLVETAETLSRVRPAVFGSISLERFYSMYAKVRSTGRPALKTRFLTAVAEARYTPADPFETADDLWLDLATIRAEQHEDIAAAELLGRIDSPDQLLRARLDNRFARWVAADPGRYDLRAAALGRLAKDQATMKSHPKLLKGPIAVAIDLVSLGRAAEALDVVRAARAATRAAARPTDAYTDWEDEKNWLADQEARIMGELGRFDERLAAMRKGAAATEHGEANVSQVINLSQDYIDLKRPQDALQTLKVFGDPGKARQASDYGFMQVMVTRACAYAQTGATEALKAAVTWLAAHEADSPSTLTAGLLCVDDEDGAAASYVRRLASPDERGEALMELCDYADIATLPPWSTDLRQRFRRVRSRPEVQAAVARVGHTESVPMRPPQGVQTY